jgi:hypothetical protein
MNTKIPDNFISIANYISRCDYIFTQPFVEIPYENNKLSDITDNSTVYCWSTFLNDMFKYLKSTNLKNITLISGCNDHSTNPNGTIIGWPQTPQDGILPCPSNIVKWYAQNAEISSKFMIPIPIGPNIYPLKSNTMKQFLFSCNRNKLIFNNTNPANNPIQRTYVQETILQQCPNSIKNILVGNTEYCMQLQQHIFSICPPSNGKDTHRAWESIFFGCIPIVEKSNMNDFFATLFPMLVVDRWSDVTEDFLINQHTEMQTKTWRYDLLDVDNLFDYYGIKKSNTHKKYHEIAGISTTGLSRNYEKCVLYY